MKKMFSGLVFVTFVIGIFALSGCDKGAMGFVEKRMVIADKKKRTQEYNDNLYSF